jgi:HD-GYP domain-containing protein (c-di-GMP phosphodiesterase class II)
LSLASNRNNPAGLSLRREDIPASVTRAIERHRQRPEPALPSALLEQTPHERPGRPCQALEQVEESRRSALQSLVMVLDSRERMTHLHSLRVQAFTLALAERCGYGPGTRREELSYGALLHDIGKIVIPDSILLKSGPLTPEETQVMRQHPARGYQLLSRIPHLQPCALLALCHHERIDGKGYPLGLYGAEIPLEARIFAVADAVDVILSGRPYCAPRTLPEARCELIRCAGSQFDKDVVDVFMQIPDAKWDHLRHQVSSRIAEPELPLPALSPVPF